jgi:hypothetical protein
MTDEEFLDECITVLDWITRNELNNAMDDAACGATCKCIEDVLSNLDSALSEISKAQNDLVSLRKRIKARGGRKK